MKRNISAVIIDSAPELTKKLMAVMGPILPQLKVQTHLDDQEPLPDVVFVNLNIGQREGSFQLMEKLSLAQKIPLFYGYLDSSTPELVAHAIESGAQDVFTKPFDEALISTKLSKHIKDERLEENQLPLKALVPSLPANVEFSFKLLSVDENGLLLHGKHYISKGTRIEFAAPIVREIFGKESLAMMFSRTSRCVEDEQSYLFYLEPVNATEAHSSALRNFIIRKKQS